MDIGAYHPFFLSNTALFYINGSHGINIEPDTNLFHPFQKYRKRDVNLNIAISDRNEVKPLYIMTIPTLNTLSLEEANRNAKLYGIEIERIDQKQCHTIEYVAGHYFNQKMPDLLTIDVEGFELDIFQSFDMKKLMPKVICVEAYDIHEDRKEIRQNLLDYLKSQGFTIYADTGLNVILTSGI
jgi:FkbM family methyltransferase